MKERIIDIAIAFSITMLILIVISATSDLTFAPKKSLFLFAIFFLYPFYALVTAPVTTPLMVGFGFAFFFSFKIGPRPWRLLAITVLLVGWISYGALCLNSLEIV